MTPYIASTDSRRNETPLDSASAGGKRLSRIAVATQNCDSSSAAPISAIHLGRHLAPMSVFIMHLLIDWYLYAEYELECTGGEKSSTPHLLAPGAKDRSAINAKRGKIVST